MGEDAEPGRKDAAQPRGQGRRSQREVIRWGGGSSKGGGGRHRLTPASATQDGGSDLCLWMGCARAVRCPQWAAGPVHRLTSPCRWCSRPPVRGRGHGRAGQGRLGGQRQVQVCGNRLALFVMAEGGRMAETGATANAEPRHCWDGTFLILLGER